MAESTPQPPEHDIEAAPQQPVQDENTLADGNKSSPSDNDKRQTYEQRLYEHVGSIRDPPFSRIFLNLRDLSQINIIHLMNELAKYDQAMRKDKAAPQDIEHIGDLLRRYTTALQDLEYWSRLPKYSYWWGMRVYNDLRQMFPAVYGDRGNLKFAYLDRVPKSPSSSVDPLRNFLKKVLPRHLTWSVEERMRYINTGESLGGKTPEETTPFVDTLARFIVAITGGLSLVIPMLVMRLGETLPKI